MQGAKTVHLPRTVLVSNQQNLCLFFLPPTFLPNKITHPNVSVLNNAPLFFTFIIFPNVEKGPKMLIPTLCITSPNHRHSSHPLPKNSLSFERILFPSDSATNTLITSTNYSFKYPLQQQVNYPNPIHSMVKQ